MEIYEEYQMLRMYLIEHLDVLSWDSAIIKIDIQPGVLGLSGDAILEDGSIVYLEVDLPISFEESIKSLHSKTAIDKSTKWNFLEFEIKKNGSFSIKYIWDQGYQDKIDKRNLEEKKRNSKYELPKWHWEK